LVIPAASVTTHRPGERSHSDTAPRWLSSTTAQDSAYMITVVHSGCMPAPSNWRNGHQDSPQMVALSIRARIGMQERGGEPRGQREGTGVGLAQQSRRRDLEPARGAANNAQGL